MIDWQGIRPAPNFRAPLRLPLFLKNRSAVPDYLGSAALTSAPSVKERALFYRSLKKKF